MYVQLQVITYILYTSSELLCLCHRGDVYVVAQYTYKLHFYCITVVLYMHAYTVSPW